MSREGRRQASNSLTCGGLSRLFSVIVLRALLLFGGREVGCGLFKALHLGQDFRQLDGTDLLGQDVFVFVEQEHLGRRIHIKRGAEVEAFQVGHATVDQGRGTVLGVDERVVTHIDPLCEFLVTDVFLPGLGFEVVANGKNLKAAWVPLVVDAFQLGHFFLQ